MQTIKSYLETMFANMPDTPEVRRAKDELYGMMEDKYNELISEGKSENEAVGTVISEFGNLDELSDIIGINKQQTPIDNRRILSMEEVKDYIRAYSFRSGFIAVGVFLCIFSVVFPIVGSVFRWEYMDAIMAGLMFVSIGIAVGLFIFSGSFLRKYDDIKRKNCVLDYKTSNYVKTEREKMRMVYAMCLAIGVVLCVISIVPPIIIDSLNIAFLDDISGATMITLVAIGVMLIVYQANAAVVYRNLLVLNNSTAMPEETYNDKKSKEVTYINDTATNVMSLYWPTVCCIYLSISFLTFDLHITWIIWLIAGVVFKALKIILEK